MPSRTFPGVRAGAARWFAVVGLLVSGRAAVAGFSVTGQRVAEGTGTAQRVEFVITLDEAAIVPEVLQFATLSGTAVAGADYASRRGSVTVPPGEAIARVNVPVIPDTEVEYDEEFGLLVWREGSTPTPVLAQISNSETVLGPRYYWRQAEAGVPGGILFTGWSDSGLPLPAVFRRGGSTWEMETRFAAPAGGSQFGHRTALGTCWFGATDNVFPGSSTGGEVRLHVWERGRVTPGVWSALPPLTIPRTFGFVSAVAVHEPWLALATGNNGTGPITVRVYELVRGGLLREVWRNLLPASSLLLRQVLISGRHLAVTQGGSETGSVVHLFEAQNDSRTDWRLVRTKAGFQWPVLLDGDRLLIGSPGQFNVFEKNAGGSNNWGQTFSGLPRDDDYFSAPELRGNLLLIGESWLPGGGPAPGQVKAFVRDGPDGAWISAGSFSSPPPAAGLFGFDVGFSGLDVAVASGGSSPAWVGSLPGGRAVLTNDDVPNLRLAPSLSCEPRGGTESAWVQAALSQTAAAPVSLAWQTLARTATPGLDYTTTSGTLIIPAGEWQGTIRIPLLPDTEIEPDETLTISVTAIDGATLAAGEAEVIIRDADATPPVLAVTLGEGYEGAAPLRWKMEAGASAEALQIPWRTERIARSGGSNEGIATPDADFTQSAGTFHALPPFASSSGTIAIPDDELAEGQEEFSLVVEPPSGTVTASWAQRLIFPLQSNPLTSTDGDWVAVTDGQSNAGTLVRGDVVLFRRAPAAPGGWVEHLRRRATDVGGTVWNVTGMALRRGALVLWDAAGSEFFFFGADEGGPGQWGFQMRVRSMPTLSAMAFDGNALLTVDPGDAWGKPNTVEAIEKDAAGQWTLRRELDTSGFSNSPMSVAVDGNVAALAGQSSAGSRGLLRILELEAGSAVRWRKVGDQFVTAASLATANAVKVNRGLVAVSAAEAPDSFVQLYRRSAGGQWLLEQTLPTVGLTAVEKGLVLANRELWARTAAAPAAWRKVASLPAVWQSPDLCSGVLTGWQQIPLGAATVPAAFIAAPGAQGVIMDDESVNYWISGSQEATESLGTMVELRIGVGFPSSQTDVSIPVEIPWQTADGTARAGADYVAGGGVLRIPPGGTGYISIPILPDTLPEATEQFKVIFGQPTFGSPASWEVTATIHNRNVPVALPSGPFVLPEPPAGEANFTVPVRLPYPIPEGITCNCEVRAGTADAADAILGTFPVNLPPGASVLPIPLTLLADIVDEATETVSLRPGLPAGFALQGAASILVQVDDANTPGLTPLNFNAQEGLVLTQAAPGVLKDNTGGYLRGRIVNPPAHGMVTLQPDGAFTYTPAPNFIGTDRITFSAIGSAADLIAADAVTTWRWRHPVNGQDPGASVPGFQANWKMVGFDDATWGSGSGLIGYGQIGPAPGLTVNTSIGTPPSSQRYTAYFRHSFQAPADSPDSLTLEFLCDDAAIFYLNGTEAGRFALAPAGNFATAADTYTLLCPVAANDADEPAIRSITLPANVATGPNLLAVSLHNQSAGSSDLAFQLHSLTTGAWSKPVTVTVTVRDGQRPPVLAADAITFPAYAPAADSRLIPYGGLFENDGLLANDGTVQDPVLEVAIGGNPAGPVTVDPATGHFRIALPPGFFGRTDFTYSVRDKDGWSEPAPVSVTSLPSAPLQIWQQQHFGPDSFFSNADPLADPDGDGLVNLLEFASRGQPLVPGFATPLNLSLAGGQVELKFNTLAESTDDTAIAVETSSDPGNAWETLAVFHSQAAPVELQAGIVQTSTLQAGDAVWHRRLQIGAPAAETRYFRLRAAVLPPWWRH